MFDFFKKLFSYSSESMAVEDEAASDPHVLKDIPGGSGLENQEGTVIEEPLGLITGKAEVMTMVGKTRMPLVGVHTASQEKLPGKDGKLPATVFRFTGYDSEMVVTHSGGRTSVVRYIDGKIPREQVIENGRTSGYNDGLPYKTPDEHLASLRKTHGFPTVTYNSKKQASGEK